MDTEFRQEISAVDLLSLLNYHNPVHLDLHSFPTRRSSDLPRIGNTQKNVTRLSAAGFRQSARKITVLADCRWPKAGRDRKSTRLNQSRFDLVCRLLLEKKKTFSVESLQP